MNGNLSGLFLAFIGTATDKTKEPQTIVGRFKSVTGEPVSISAKIMDAYAEKLEQPTTQQKACTGGGGCGYPSAVID